MSSETDSLEFVNGVEQVLKSKTYNTFLLDMWGVMHDGSKPYEGVLNTVSKLRKNDMNLVILSNSSKRKSNSIKMLTKLGFDPEKDFEQIITSGEVAYQMLAGNKDLPCEIWPVLTQISKDERKVFVFGSGDGDEEYCTSCGWTLAPISEANLILARGTFTINNGNMDDTVSKKIDGEDAYFKEHDRILEIASSRKIPMLISNPDKVRPDKGLPPMPGAIGDAYEKTLGGGSEATALVKRIGKPFSEVYEIALKNKDPAEACMVGDALETDVTGGTSFGCDTLWVIKDGIHAPTVLSEETKCNEDYEEKVGAALQTFNDLKRHSGDERLSPTFIVPHFRW